MRKKTNEEWLAEAKAISDEYEWLEEYKGNNVKIKYFHKVCGNINSMAPHNFLKKRTCPICAANNRGIGNRCDPKEMEKRLADSGYQIIGKYEKYDKKIKAIHLKCGNIIEARSDHILNANGCKYCKTKNIKETTLKKYGVYNIKQLHIGKEKIDILNNKEKLIEYIENLKYKPTVKNIIKLFGVDISTIYDRINDFEIEHLIDFVASNGEKEIKEAFPQINFRTRNILPNKQELDCYSEKDKLAVEYNGSYWHSVNENTNKKAKPQNYHDNKTRMCQELGIRLIHIWDFEWNTRQEQCIKLISNALNLNKEKIYARNCTIGYPTSLEYEKFMEKEHIQGSSKASIKIGLYYDNKLVMCCGIRNESNQYNLVRMASSINVIGGASRLAKHFPTDKSMVTFCDTGKFTGTVYPKMGFKKVGEVPPRYVWVNSQYDIKSRRACQKQYICKTDDDWNKTEVEIMTEKGYYQCYGSHLDKYVRDGGK